MDFFIKKIAEKNTDELVHQQFQKFSRGQFPDKAMVRIKNSNGKYNISTTSEYAKEFVINFAERLGEESAMVTGALISALDLDGFDYKEKKMAMGIRKYIIEKSMSGNEILELCRKVDRAFFGLSFEFNGNDLKIQAKSPKSAKGVGSSKKQGEKTKIDFCKIKTSDKSIVEGLVFENIGSFKNLEIKHDFIIEDIVISNELKEEYKNDFAKLREMVLRKGKIIRILEVDGKETKKEIEFEA